MTEVTEIPNHVDGPSTGARILPPVPGNRHHYRARLAKAVLDEAPGQPMWSTGGDPKSIVALHYHAGRCDQSAKRRREHADLNAQWTSLLENVGFTVRAGRCGVVATCALPPTRAVVEPVGPAEEFTRKVTFPDHKVGGLLRLEPTYASADYSVLTDDGDFLWSVKTIDQGVAALALYWGLPDDDIPTTHVPRGHQALQPPASPEAAPPALRPAAVTLLRTLGRLDTGSGVTFHHAPAGRWRLEDGSYTVNDRTFHPLESAGLIDVGDGSTDPVRITDAGRAWLAAHPQTTGRHTACAGS
ncbi:hypothetical protein ACFC0S_16200 [Streptomyces sp. NPDC056084]|uniref:hypothetical protein n=1 Tax=unclassified Streptomyces TaxID=2593676 RepID=UPI0035D5BBA8